MQDNIDVRAIATHGIHDPVFDVGRFLREMEARVFWYRNHLRLTYIDRLVNLYTCLVDLTQKSWHQRQQYHEQQSNLFTELRLRASMLLQVGVVGTVSIRQIEWITICCEHTWAVRSMETCH